MWLPQHPPSQAEKELEDQDCLHIGQDCRESGEGGVAIKAYQ